MRVVLPIASIMEPEQHGKNERLVCPNPNPNPGAASTEPGAATKARQQRLQLRTFRQLARFQMRDRLRSLLYSSVEESAAFFESFGQTEREEANPLLADGRPALFVVELQVRTPQPYDTISETCRTLRLWHLLVLTSGALA